jgi:cell division septation protein DedD
LALGFGLPAFVLPGLFGNALLHRDCRKRMAKALAAHSVVAEACTELLQQASSRRRGLWLAGANAAVLAAVVLAYLQFSALGSVAVMPQGALEAGHVSVRPSGEAPVPPASALASLSATVSALPVSAPVSLPQVSASALPTPPASAASAPIAMASSASASTAAPATAASPVAVSIPAAVPTPTKVASQTVEAAPLAATSTPVARASIPAAKATPKKEAEKIDKRAKVSPPAPSPKRVASAPPSSNATDKPYFINVGLFAKPENAANAHAKLLEAQLPSVTKALKSSKGPLTRVRVGPFASQSEAQAAAEKIKALQLDAMIVQP